jgi:hypothetical protein
MRLICANFLIINVQGVFDGPMESAALFMPSILLSFTMQLNFYWGSLFYLCSKRIVDIVDI